MGRWGSAFSDGPAFFPERSSADDAEGETGRAALEAVVWVPSCLARTGVQALWWTPAGQWRQWAEHLDFVARGCTLPFEVDSWEGWEGADK